MPLSFRLSGKSKASQAVACPNTPVLWHIIPIWWRARRPTAITGSSTYLYHSDTELLVTSRSSYSGDFPIYIFSLVGGIRLGFHYLFSFAPIPDRAWWLPAMSYGLSCPAACRLHDSSMRPLSSSPHSYDHLSRVGQHHCQS